MALEVGYSSSERFIRESNFPDDLAKKLGVKFPGYIESRLAMNSSWMNSQLSQRYDVPFLAVLGEQPPVIYRWLYSITDEDCWNKIAPDPNDAQFVAAQRAADQARKDIQAAVNPSNDTTLFGLPVKVGSSLSGIVAPGVIGYSEESPFVGERQHRERARLEDQQGTGTFYGGRNRRG